MVFGLRIHVLGGYDEMLFAGQDMGRIAIGRTDRKCVQAIGTEEGCPASAAVEELRSGACLRQRK